MLTDGQILQRSISVFPEFDLRKPRLYPLEVASRTRKSVLLSPEVVEAAKLRGVSLGEYVQQLHQNQRSSRIAYAASIYRGFALLEMARVPVDPAYYELVDGCMNTEDSKAFRIMAASGEENALVKAAQLLGDDTRKSAVQAVLLAASRAQVLHEGFIEAARLLEATFYR
jgi:hypothetical protein